jgi:hypothetical protein
MKRFVECETREQAETACPWANFFAEAEGGWWCFEFEPDYRTWLNQV